MKLIPTGSGAGKLITVMVVGVVAFFIYNYMKKRRA